MNEQTCLAKSTGQPVNEPKRASPARYSHSGDHFTTGTYDEAAGVFTPFDESFGLDQPAMYDSATCFYASKVRRPRRAPTTTTSNVRLWWRGTSHRLSTAEG